MNSRIATALAFLLLLTLTLVACGDENKTYAIPTYSGGTSITAPAAFKSQEASLSGNVKNGKIEYFKTADAPSKVKTAFTDSFKKDGWKDETSTMGADTVSQMEAMQGFMMLYTNGTQAVAVVGFPNSVAALLEPSLGATDSLYIVISGQGK